MRQDCHATQLSWSSERLLVLPENSYKLIFLTFFRRDVNLKSLGIVTAKEHSES